MKILVLNSGSSSLKYQLIDMNNEQVLAKGNFERIGQNNSFLTHKVGGEKHKFEKPVSNHEKAIKFVLKKLQSNVYGVIKSPDEINAIGHRIVHGGEKFTKPVIITDEVMKGIEECIELAPLHNPAAILGIKACQSVMPGKTNVAVFDTSFHQTIPAESYIYPIPYKYYEDYKIRKYGFHGTSHEYVANRVAEIMNKDIKDLKIVNCHLGQGASVCAIKNGKSYDTSMGFTPLEGLVMETRCGDLDPAIVTKLMREENLSVDEMDNVLNKKSGRLGLSGIGDFRMLKEAGLSGDKQALLTRMVQNQRTKKYIGAYIAELNRVDAIVFTGGVMENNADEIEMTISDMDCLGIELDKEANEKGIRKESLVSKPTSKIKLYIIPTNEELQIAKETVEVVSNVK